MQTQIFMLYYCITMENLRLNNRKNNEMRNVNFTLNFTNNKDGSCLVCFGDTKVLCNATFQNGFVPTFLKNSEQGWLSAEYAMLPKATESRNTRESVKGQQSGRSVEIQRLIGRSLRAALDLEKLGKNSIIIDCDVLQADGGTRTASITGGFVALVLCVQNALKMGYIKENPIKTGISAVSVGIMNGITLLDLDYKEDSNTSVDANFIISDEGNLIDISASAEKEMFSETQLYEMIEYAKIGCKTIQDMRKKILNDFFQAEI